MKTYRLKAKSYKLKATQRGQVMLEAVVALTIMTIGLLGIFSILSSSIAANRASTNKEIAVNLAAEGIEVVKSIIDENYIENELIPTPFNDGLTNMCPSTSPGAGCRVQYDSESVMTGSLTEPLRFHTTEKLYGYFLPSVSVPTIFKRTLTIDSIPALSPIQLKVISTVSWTERNNTPFSVVLEDRFYDWRPEEEL